MSDPGETGLAQSSQGQGMDGRRRRCLVPALLPGTSEVGGGMLWIAHLTLAATPLSTFPALEWGPSFCRPNTEHRTMSPRTSRVTSTSNYLRRLGAVSIPKRKGEPLRANCSLALGFSGTPQHGRRFPCRPIWRCDQPRDAECCAKMRYGSRGAGQAVPGEGFLDLNELILVRWMDTYGEMGSCRRGRERAPLLGELRCSSRWHREEA
jgi:hypothetical protein